MIACPADYGLMEKGDLKTYLENAGLEILQIVSIPISEALALHEKNKKLGKNGDVGPNKYILLDWISGAVSATAYETSQNKPIQLLNTFNDSNLTHRMLEKQQTALIKSKLKNPKEIDLTNDIVENTLLGAFQQFQSGAEIAKIKLSESNEIEITFKEMVKLCSLYVEKSSQLTLAILHERKMKLTDFTRVYYCCPLPYSDFANHMYEEMFKEYKLNQDFFVFEQNLNTLESISFMVKILITIIFSIYIYLKANIMRGIHLT